MREASRQRVLQRRSKGQPIPAEADRPVISWRRGRSRAASLGLPMGFRGGQGAQCMAARPEGGRQGLGWLAAQQPGVRCQQEPSPQPAPAPPCPRAPPRSQPAGQATFLPQAQGLGNICPSENPAPLPKGQGGSCSGKEQERGGYTARGWMAGCIYLTPPTPATPCRWDPPLSSSGTWISPGHMLHPLT